METIADKVMKMRIHSENSSGDKKSSTSKAKSLDSLNSSINSTALDSYLNYRRRSSQTSSRGSRTNSRPESVAQRILRERQEQNLRTRFLVNDEDDNQSQPAGSVSASATKGRTLPLHLALRQSAAKHKQLAVAANQTNGTVPKSDGDVSPPRSILKKNTSNGTVKPAIAGGGKKHRVQIQIQ